MGPESSTSPLQRPSGPITPPERLPGGSAPSGRGFTWHGADASILAGFPELRPLQERLAERYWPGPLTLILRRVAGLRIGFVCTGNTCRSPMAETLAWGLLAERLGGDLDTYRATRDSIETFVQARLHEGA